MIFELLFLFLVFVTALALGATLVLLVLRRNKTAFRALGTTAAAWIVYMAILAGVSASTPQRVLNMNEDLCFDEMCFAAVGLHIAPQLGPVDQATKARGVFVVVTIKVSNHSRGRTQSEGGLRVRLWDGARYYGVSAEGQNAHASTDGRSALLASRLSPGETVRSAQVFDVPLPASGLRLVLDHGMTPGDFVIGESPWFHDPTVTKLAPSPSS